MEENQNSVPENVEVVVAERSALSIMERASIDIQIATAHQYPRSISVFTKRAKEMVSVDKETAESCIYRRPVGKENGKMKYAEGESIRLAEIVAACYGNMRVGGVITETHPKYVKAQGIAHDLESNYAAKADVIESTVDKNGRPYSERQRLVIAKAAQSKAMRDAIFRVVSKSLCKSIVTLAKETAFGKTEPLAIRRDRAMAWLKKLCIDLNRVWSALDIQGEEELGDAELETLTGIRTAIKDGDTTVEEAFPPLTLPDEQPNKGGAAGLTNALKKEDDAKGTQ
ncbi:MAG: hypothetical protein A2Y12_01205 [Planctomycetes bacterium GWF2_42_9]|nr:MAG: hypothetical protein A2Y12_01205 [Planctomycetes bacterium GWF2_42_9]